MTNSDLPDESALDDLGPELGELERRTWRSLADDGLADLLLGLAIGSFALGMLTGEGALAAIAPALFVMQWKPLHQRWIEPRRGRVVPLPARRRRARSALLRMVALQVALVLVGIGAWLAMTSAGTRELLSELMPVIVMLPVAVILLALGWWFDQPRFLVHGALAVLLIAGLHAAGAPEGWALLAVGVLLALQGAWLLVRFLRRHPRAAASGGEA